LKADPGWAAIQKSFNKEFEAERTPAGITAWCKRDPQFCKVLGIKPIPKSKKRKAEDKEEAPRRKRRLSKKNVLPMARKRLPKTRNLASTIRKSPPRMMKLLQLMWTPRPRPRLLFGRHASPDSVFRVLPWKP
jgi:hypothetical protein